MTLILPAILNEHKNIEKLNAFEKKITQQQQGKTDTQ
jgi:hypothetical protein